MNFKRKGRRNRGITLIALVITIIVLLILAGVTINTLFDNGNAIDKAAKARDETNKANIKEQLDLAVITSRINDNNANIDTGKLESELEKLKDTGIIETYEPSGEDFELPCTVTKDNYEFTIDKDGNVKDGPYTPNAEGPTIIVEGKEITLTKENVKDYLGKVVTNFKEEGEGTEDVTIGEHSYKVSTRYRLYYVDFDNKYGDGYGTIYLKADCIHNNYYISLTNYNPTENNDIKMEKLNPELYKVKEGSSKIPPNSENENIKACTWLLDGSNWSDLKESSGVKIPVESIKYIVGSPSLEMMIDSYNMHYNLVGEIPDTSEILEGERRKLFYRSLEQHRYGYQVGPSVNYEGGFGYAMIDNSVSGDIIDSMYFPGKYLTNGYNQYWLASPCWQSVSDMFYVTGRNGMITRCYGPMNVSNGFCPVACLSSSVKLNLED